MPAGSCRTGCREPERRPRRRRPEFPLKGGTVDFLLCLDGAAAGAVEAKKKGWTLSDVEACVLRSSCRRGNFKSLARMRVPTATTFSSCTPWMRRDGGCFSYRILCS